MMLSEAERDKFQTYLEEDARATELIVNQLEHMSGASDPMVIKLRTELLAERVVAAKLRGTQSVTYEGGD